MVILAGLFLYLNNKNQAEYLLSLKPKEADRPAAGVCDKQNPIVVVLIIREDVPMPRCAKVRPDQKIRVVNGTEEKMRIGFKDVSPLVLAPRTIELTPQAGYTFRIPVNQYLEPGIHHLSVSSRLSSPEIWVLP